MKKIYVYILVFFTAILASCEKPDTSQNPEIDLIPAAGYIRFSTGVATKAPIIENLRGENFGVLGYSYEYGSRWDVARALAKPVEFYNQAIACADNGVCTYDIDNSTTGNQLKSWDLSKKYSFFGYYPMTATNNGISISASDKVDMPTVTYSLPLKSKTEGEVNPNDLQDLMTASALDKTASDGKVGFTFQHRLFCIEVLAQNFNSDIINQETSEMEFDKDEKISNLKLTINNLAYEGITVPMKKGDSNPTFVNNSKGAVDFRLLAANEVVTIPSHNESDGVVSLSGTDGSKMVMLVPQDASKTNLSCSVSFDLTNSLGTTESKTIDFTSDLNFQEGKKYNIVISFTGATIVIALAESGAWQSVSIPIEFE